MLENLSQTESSILEKIRTVIDPEVEVNIVDLGLIYNVKHNEEEKKVHVLLTLSARGCPVGDVIIQHVEFVVKSHLPDHEVTVELTWEPEWTPELISEEGKKILNA